MEKYVEKINQKQQPITNLVTDFGHNLYSASLLEIKQKNVKIIGLPTNSRHFIKN